MLWAGHVKAVQCVPVSAWVSVNQKRIIECNLRYALFFFSFAVIPCYLFICTIRHGCLPETPILQLSLWVKSQRMLSLWVCNCDVWGPHTLPDPHRDRRGHAGRWITNTAQDHSSIRADPSPGSNSFPPAAPDGAETLARATASSRFVPEVQLSLLELFWRFSVKASQSVCVNGKQPASSLEGPDESIWEAVHQTGGARTASDSTRWSRMFGFFEIKLLFTFFFFKHRAVHRI